MTDRLIRISIFLRDSTLFAYFEYQGEDLERDLAAISADPETQRWWKLTDPCQEPWPDRGTGGHWSDLAEVWHLGEPADEPLPASRHVGRHRHPRRPRWELRDAPIPA